MTKVCIVDDSPFQRRNLKKILESSGYQVMEASSGQQCLELLAGEKPDCIITDILMPGMNGIELLRELKNIGHTSPVIVLSADVQPENLDTCKELGAKAFLNKPVNKNNIENVLSQVLDK